jgi:hypothetical protein
LGVPIQYWEYWKTAIDIQVYEIYPSKVREALMGGLAQSRIIELLSLSTHYDTSKSKPTYDL